MIISRNRTMKRFIILTFILIFSLSLVSASQESFETFKEFHRNIPAFNEQLQQDPILLHPLVQTIANNEDIAVHVKTNQGHIESFVISIYENYVTSIIAGPQPTKLYVEIDEDTVNEIIESPELAIVYYKEGIIQVKSTSTVKKTKLFVIRTLAKWFI